MKSSKKIDVFSKSALVNLKAELSKKQDEARLAKLRAKGNIVTPTPIPKKLTEFNKTNRGIEERNQKDAEEIAEEEASLKKSKSALEEKAKLYEKLLQGQENNDDSRFLVNFDQKVIEEGGKPNDHSESVTSEKEDSIYSDDYDDNPSDSEDDWVEYRDCLGRTRTCLRRDLPFIKSKDEKLADSLGMTETKPKAEEKSISAEAVKSAVNENLELMSEDMKKQELRKKWEQQEVELRDKSDVHYQDVLFDEVRTHGVAYYAFSREEKSRQAELEELRKLRSETEKGQAAALDLKERRKKQMEARLKAARARKRAREGLPPEPEENTETAIQESSVDETFTMWPDCKIAEEAKAEEEERERRRAKIEEAEEKRKKKVLPVRPWDIGKEGVLKDIDPMSQEEWVKMKRDERPTDFAPPSEYSNSQKDFSHTEYVDSEWNVSHLRCSTSKQKYVRGKKKSFTKIPIEDEIITHDQIDDDGNRDKDSLKSRKRAEIPPPPTFDYYGPSSSKQIFQQSSGNKTDQASLEDAITAGLHYLRQQAEEREKQKEKGLLGII